MGATLQPGQETMDSQMKAYIDNLDAYTGATTRNMLPTEQAMLDTRMAIGPQQREYELSQAEKYLPRFTQVGLDQQQQQNMGQARNDTALLNGPGRDLVSANLAAQKLADPEYYASRALAAEQLQRLNGSLDDPNGGLSPTERAEIERSTARTNAQRGLEAPTGTSAVESAMNFGNAGAARKLQKQQAINSAVQTAGQIMPSMRSGVDVLQLTTGRPSQQNQGLGQMGANREVGQASMNMGNQLFQQAGENSRQTADINSKKRSAMDTALEIGSQVSSMASGI